MDHTESFSELLELHSHKRLGQHIGYLLVCFHVLELHCSSLQHILDIVELYLDVLRLIMEHWVFRQAQTTWIVAEDASQIQLDIK